VNDAGVLEAAHVVLGGEWEVLLPTLTDGSRLGQPAGRLSARSASAAALSPERTAPSMYPFQ
jgi:hypothetical protein